MRKVLLDEMKVMLRERQISIHFDSKSSAVTSDSLDRVDFEFAKGKTASTPLLIGADGVH